MRVYYICPRRVWEEPIDFGGMTLPRYNLFHHGVGSSCIHLDDAGDWLLVSTDFSSEAAQEIWHSHPEVARLPHPTQQSNVLISRLSVDPQHARKQFKSTHWDLLVAKFGLNPTHTVWDLHDKATSMDPLCRLSNVY
jgi:hypothetical protein